MSKSNIGLRIDEALIERVHNAIWALGNRTTITEICVNALLTWVEIQEVAHNKGKPFPQREGDLPFAPKKPRKMNDIHIGTFYSHCLGDEDHDLFLDLDTLQFHVEVERLQETTILTLDDYLSKYPERRNAMLDAVRAYFD